MQTSRRFLKTKKVEVTNDEIAANIDWVKATIKTDLFTTQFGQSAGFKVQTESDPQVQKALTFLPQAQALLDQSKAKTTVAQK